MEGLHWKGFVCWLFSHIRNIETREFYIYVHLERIVHSFVFFLNHDQFGVFACRSFLFFLIFNFWWFWHYAIDLKWSTITTAWYSWRWISTTWWSWRITAAASAAVTSAAVTSTARLLMELGNLDGLNGILQIDTGYSRWRAWNSVALRWWSVTAWWWSVASRWCWWITTATATMSATESATASESTATRLTFFFQ